METGAGSRSVVAFVDQRLVHIARIIKAPAKVFVITSNDVSVRSTLTR